MVMAGCGHKTGPVYVPDKIVSSEQLATSSEK